MWIIIAWLHVWPQLTVKDFKKCCISSAVDRTDVLWNDSEEDGAVRSECEVDEDTNCKDGGSDTDW
jgi:hypothetical protein